MTLPTLHLMLLAGWGGVLASEIALELLPLRRPELRAATAVFHYYIDLFVELPVLVGVVATGVLMLFGRPLDTRLVVKVVCAGVAVSANLACIALVVLRHRGPADQLAARSRLVFATAVAGFPAGAVALYLGLTRPG